MSTRAARQRAALFSTRHQSSLPRRMLPAADFAGGEVIAGACACSGFRRRLKTIGLWGKRLIRRRSIGGKTIKKRLRRKYLKRNRGRDHCKGRNHCRPDPLSSSALSSTPAIVSCPPVIKCVSANASLPARMTVTLLRPCSQAVAQFATVLPSGRAHGCQSLTPRSPRGFPPVNLMGIDRERRPKPVHVWWNRLSL